jgi:hypothetical protein
MELEYGSVLITKGKYKDKIGYYDDDDCDTDKAIVYLGEPFTSDYILINPKYLVNIPSISHELFKKRNKELCERMGVR